jgi:hypothetical protein
MWAEVDGERKKVAWYVLSFFLSLIDDCLPHSTITVTYTDVVAGIFYIANLHTRLSVPPWSMCLSGLLSSLFLVPILT